MKYGQKFALSIEALPDLSVFFDLSRPEDQFWVAVQQDKAGKVSITFEETLEDFQTDCNENVITNLVHLEVMKTAEGYVIQHIDHEYISYSLSSYASRLENSKIKGENKIKTFKIDNAKIPLDYKIDGSNILFLIVHECMEKQNLVKEYFDSL